MLEELLRADRLSQVIDHTTAPAFLLGAIAAFLAIMLTRVENLMQRMGDGKSPLSTICCRSSGACDSFTGIPDAQERADIITYLKTVTAQ